MASPLVQTKLYIPKLRRSLVARPRLSGRLGRGAESRLLLISAPAGFGKTTVLAEWLAAAPERSVAWLSLEESDRQPATYWTYLIAALQTVAPAVGGSALELLQSAQASIETLLATVLNELSSVPDDIYLMLDDYHLVDGPDIQPGMTFLVEHLPPQVHLVISTREDPALPLARLRARGELVEVRAVDLRFTPEEAAAYLNGAMGLALTPGDVAALEGRTEGWIAALQLAALSMRGRDDVAGFIADFAGDDRYIVDYLAEEVLQRQPEQTHLFLVPLDDRRRWYRYHHLFADVLHTHLLEDQPDDVPELHRRASGWYEQHDEPSGAIRHALAAGDVERAAELVELTIPALRRNRQEATIRSWLEALPDEVIRVRPVLEVGLIGALMAGNEFEGVEERLQHVEGWLEPAGAGAAGAWAPPAGTVVDQDEFQRLPGVIQQYRAALALIHGDAPATVSHAQRAIDRAPEADHLTRAGASALMGLALWGDGDLEAAHRAYSVCVEGLQRAGYIADVLGCSITLADIRITQGRLRDAQRTYEEALRLAAGPDGTVLRGTADMYVGMSQIACERNNLARATEHLRHAEELGEHTWLPQNPYRWRVAMARVREAEGDLDGALGLLEEARRVYTGDFSPNVRPIPAMRARVQATNGRVGDALAWAREQGLSAEDDLSYLREFEHVTLARVLLAQHRAQPAAASLQDVARLLERLLQAAEAGERTGTAIEILMLQALTRHARGNVPGALAALERALTLAEPEGYVRLFASEGPPMASLLRVAANQGIAPSYVHRLLAAVNRSKDRPPPQQGLIEPLSQRELEVLRLLGSDLDGPDIARELTVSLNTVRTHTKSIYAKLGVNSRRAAVRRAGELDLLSRRRDR
jgi:LuxR family maltose regulon positive regulatory protein